MESSSYTVLGWDFDVVCSYRVRPSLVAGNGQQSQAPPPYYAENKALEHSLDHALAMEDSKTPAYSQPGYGYHQPNHNINGKNLPKT